MLVVLDIDTTDKTRAAEILCELFETLMPQAQADALGLPALYDSGTKYASQDPRACAFRRPNDIAKLKKADCKQLVLWRLAELRNAGESAKPRILWLTHKKKLQAHAQVRRGDKTIEDPSVLLGMSGASVKKAGRQRA